MPIGPWWSKAPYATWAFTSAARTATPTAAEVVNIGNFPIAQIFVSVTVDPASASVVFNFDVYNKKAGTWVEVLDSAAVTGVSENVYQIGGVGSESADLFASVHPSSKIRIRPVHADSDSFTYSVAVQWLRN